MKAKFIGDPRNPGEQKLVPDEYTAFGLTFERGKFTDVPAHLEGKINGNSHFQVQGASNAKATTDAPETTETVAQLSERVAASDDVDALKAELATEQRSTAKKVLEDRIADLEA